MCQKKTYRNELTETSNHNLRIVLPLFYIKFIEVKKIIVNRIDVN